MLDFLKIFKKSSKGAQQNIILREAFKNKYYTFQKLLTKNNHILELMADMEEKLSGEYLFDRHYINTNVRLIADGVFKIIENLNALSNNKYIQLYKVYDDIYKEIDKTLSHKLAVPVSDLTIPLEKLTSEMSDIAGGKIAHLGEIKNRLNLLTPDGFAITAYAFKRLMEDNRFTERINERLSAVSIDNMAKLNEVSKKIQNMVIGAEIPDDLEKAIRDAYSKLCDKAGQKVMVSVRSSALQEDGEFSFAGQYSTFLNVRGDLILQRYKEVVASLFTPQAIFYYKTKGFQEYDMVMSVGVLAMVDARAGGVMYSKDPNDPQKNTIIISAIWGLGKCAVEGVVTPETYTVSRYPDTAIIEKRIPRQETMLVCRPDGELEEVVLSDDMKGKPCLTDEQIKVLADYAIALENHYKCPQDIEWAIDENSQPYILQTRPLRVAAKEAAKPVPTRISGYNILIDKGVIACKGIGFGKACVIRTEEDLKNFPEGAVLVARHTSTKFVTVMNKASAIITDVGGAAGHMASLSREYRIPTILDTEVATTTIKGGQEITVDAINCNIYDGKVNELLEYALKKKEPFKDTHLFTTLEKVLKWIVPLNLADPEDENFKPEYCMTFHDITRFAHEKAMHEMFKITGIPSVEDGEAVRLVAGIPLDAYLIDLGDGIEGAPKKLRPEHIRSAPFNAFFRGLVSMKWPEPRPFDVKGFFGMVAHTTSIPEGELEQVGEKSFSFISSEYMNFSIRLGYHLSTVEACARENINDNYIRFFFKGGGAVRDRKLRRVRLITEILKKMDFKVNVTEDVIDAIITKYKKSTIEEKLEILGKLTAYTKQLDMVMYNDAITDWYIEEFVKDHMKQ